MQVNPENQFKAADQRRVNPELSAPPAPTKAGKRLTFALPQANRCDSITRPGLLWCLLVPASPLALPAVRLPEPSRSLRAPGPWLPCARTPALAPAIHSACCASTIPLGLHRSPSFRSFTFLSPVRLACVHQQIYRGTFFLIFLTFIDMTSRFERKKKRKILDDIVGNFAGRHLFIRS